MARSARVTARLGTQTRPVRALQVTHGFGLGSADIAGLDGSVEWDDAPPVDVPVLPTDPGWGRDAGTALLIDWTDDEGTVRVATARLDGSDGGSLAAAVTSSLTDWTSRLETECEVRPVAWTMPRNTALSGSTPRRVGLFGVWVTHQALSQSGFHPCQALQSSAVAYHSMCGSTWPSPDPDSTYLPLGEVRQAYRLTDYGTPDPANASSTVQGDDLPCTASAYVLGVTRTRRRSGIAHWQLTVDLGTRTPPPTDKGSRVTLRPLRASDGPGIRLDATPTQVRVQRVDGSTVTTLGTYPRGTSMRWSVVARADGTATLYNDLQGSTPVAQLSGTGVTALPTGSGEASYVIEAPGMIGAVQITRSDSAFLVTQQVGARIHRSSLGGRSLAAFDWVPPRQAGDVLALQARAELGWRGLPVAQWIDEDGRLINADIDYLMARPVAHVLTTAASDGTALDGHTWSAPGRGPWREVVVTTRWGRVRLRNSPTLLLGEGARSTIERGERLEQLIHPRHADHTWLDIDTYPYMAGHPYPSPPYSPETGHEYDRALGTWVGGSVQSAVDGSRVGWLEIGHVPEWTLGTSGTVNGALSVLDPATVLISGTMNVLAGTEMSTMPDPGSAGLPEHRKQQPLAQLRGTGDVEWEEQTERVEVTGDSRHPVYTHDGGMWTSNPAHRAYVAAELAASLTDPALVVEAQTAINPRVRVGQKVALVETYATGQTRTIVGVVARRRLALGGRDDVMHLTVVRTSDSLAAPGIVVPPPDDPPAAAPPVTPIERPSPIPRMPPVIDSISA